MTLEKLTRATLLLSVPFNLIAAYGLLFSASSLGQLMGLPPEVPLGYSALLSYMVFAFGGVYGWLALQNNINRGLLCVGVIGKMGVFFITLGLWLMNEAAGRVVIVSCGDFGFASLWLLYLLKSSRA